MRGHKLYFPLEESKHGTQSSVRNADLYLNQDFKSRR